VAGGAEKKQPLWRPAVNLSVIAAMGGVLFVLVGAFLAAWITFGFGAVCAAVAAMLLRRHDHHPAKPR
jgi:hypothetical protein